MSGPRHLWAGDWQRESAAVSRELAGHRGRDRHATDAATPAASTPAPATPAARRLRLRWTWRPGAGLTRAGLVRVAVPIALGVALLLAGGAVGLDALVGSSGSTTSTAATTPTRTEAPGARPIAWLGMRIETAPPSGVVVQSVGSGSAAAGIGLKPGDLIREVGHRRITETADIARAIRGLRRGARVDITVDDAGTSSTIRATLAAPPAPIR